MPDHRGQLANILFAWLMVTPQILLLRLALSNDIVAGSLAAATFRSSSTTHWLRDG